MDLPHLPSMEKGGPVSEPVFDENGYFEGFAPRECGDHRTVGEHRAWCHDCGEWCYPGTPCVRCEIVSLRLSTCPPKTRTNDYATSVEGAVQVEGRAPNQRWRLLHEYFRDDEYNGNGLTDEQAAEYAGLLASCYWKRCGELRADGLIEFTGDTRPGAAGTSRNISRITERGWTALRVGSATG